MKKWRLILRFLKNKYILTLIIFTVWLLLFDSNNLIDRISQVKALRQLERDRLYYLERIEEDSKKLKELETDKESLEKFAREQYLMKKEDEEIFVIIDESEEKE
ncbi:MAG: septum formation inhibitor [Bacteroidales bacterium]|nr:MAG: septum formation inhibitor [Bacteroidales bacterium]